MTAACFDLDETLVDHRGLPGAIAEVCRALAEASGVGAGRLLAANGEVWAEYWPAVEGAWVAGALDRRTLVSEVWGRVLEACGVADDSLVELAIEVERERIRESYRLFEDAGPAVEAARRGGLGVALVTNGEPGTQRDKLDALGIEGWFDVVVISGELGVGKPDPAPFWAALDALGAAPRGSWHVGDSLRADVAGANAAGLTSVWLNRAGRTRQPDEPEPDLEVESLAALTAGGPPGR